MEEWLFCILTMHAVDRNPLTMICASPRRFIEGIIRRSGDLACDPDFNDFVAERIKPERQSNADTIMSYSGSLLPLSGQMIAGRDNYLDHS